MANKCWFDKLVQNVTCSWDNTKLKHSSRLKTGHDYETNNRQRLTLELVSTLTSVVMFLFFNWVLTSAKKSSPFLTPLEVIACKCITSKAFIIKKDNNNNLILTIKILNRFFIFFPPKLYNWNKNKNSRLQLRCK